MSKKKPETKPSSQPEQGSEAQPTNMERNSTRSDIRYVVEYRINSIVFDAREKLFGGAPIENERWRPIPFKGLGTPQGPLNMELPINDREWIDMGGTLSYPVAQSVRWYFISRCQNLGIGVDTRLVRKRVVITLKVEDFGPTEGVPAELMNWQGKMPEHLAEHFYKDLLEP